MKRVKIDQTAGRDSEKESGSDQKAGKDWEKKSGSYQTTKKETEERPKKRYDMEKKDKPPPFEMAKTLNKWAKNWTIDQKDFKTEFKK